MMLIYKEEDDDMEDINDDELGSWVSEVRFSVRTLTSPSTIPNLLFN